MTIAKQLFKNIITSKKKFILLTCLVLLFIIPRLFFSNSSVNLTDLELIKAQDSTKLFVVLHSFSGKQSDLKKVHQTILSKHPDSDIFSPTYNNGITANTPLTAVARQLDAHISRIYKDKKETGAQYSEIIFVGHSVGALLARKSYLFGKRIASDGAFKNNQTTQAAWTTKVSRFVLLSATNRGWNEETFPAFRRLKLKIIRPIFKYMGLGKMLFQAERGAPFVSNLKIDWLNFIKNQPLVELPPVIQLLGEQDLQTPIGDHNELIAAPNFILMDTPNTGHYNVVDMDINSNKVTPETIRAKMFSQAISESIDQLKTHYPSNNSYWKDSAANITFNGDRKNVKHVIFILHGIRDHGKWVGEFREDINSKYSNIATVTSDYGYLSMGRFLIFGDRDEKVQWFVDQYTEAQSLFPNATEFSFIGHSNGTYILAKSLEQYDAIKFDQVYFAGSVVRSNFEWSKYQQANRIKSIRNDISIDDWVVAWFPKLYQIIQQQLGFSQIDFFDLGDAGFNGFNDKVGNKIEGLVKGGHKAALQGNEKRASILNFIIHHDSGNLPSINIEPKEKIWLSILKISSKLAWVIWLSILVILIAAAMAFNRLRFVIKTGEKSASLFKSNWLSKNFGIVLFLILVILILYTI